MVQNTEKYTVITGASSGIGYETAKAFAERGSSLILIARRKDRLEALRQEILALHPMLDIVVKAADLSVPQNVFQLYVNIKSYPLQTWVNNAVTYCAAKFYVSAFTEGLAWELKATHAKIQAIIVL